MIQQPVNETRAYQEPYDPKANPYPSMRYHVSGKKITIHSAEEEPEGDEWADKSFPPAEVKSFDDRIAEMQSSFNAAWTEKCDECDKLKDDLNDLQLAFDALKSEHEALVAKQADKKAAKKSGNTPE